MSGIRTMLLDSASQSGLFLSIYCMYIINRDACTSAFITSKVLHDDLLSFLIETELEAQALSSL